MNISVCYGISTTIMEKYNKLKYLTGLENVFRYTEDNYLSIKINSLSNFQKIIFMYSRLNMNLTKLPDELQYLRLSFNIRFSLEKTQLNTKSIKMLTIEDDVDGDIFNENNIINFDSKHLPKNLEYLDIYETYINNLDDFVVPEKLEVFILPKNFNGNINKIKWNNSIKIILFGHLMNQNIDCLSQLDSLKCIKVGNYFNQKINSLPKNLELLNFCSEIYEYSLEHLDKDNLSISCNYIRNNNFINTLPTNLKILNIARLDSPLLNLPPSLKTINLFEQFENRKNIEKSKIPFDCNINFWYHIDDLL